MDPRQDRYFAIVSNDWRKAAAWFQEKEHLNISRWVEGHLMFIMKNGDKYKVITKAQQAEGYRFFEIIIDPTYTDLLTEVKKRML